MGNSFEKKLQTHKRLGVGGMNCFCCGPTPSYKTKWLRNGKKRVRRFWKQDVEKQIASKY